MRNALLRFIESKLPYAIIIAITCGFIIAFLINRIDFVIRGLVVVIPAISAAIIMVHINKKRVTFDDTLYLFKLNRRLLVLSFVLFFITSIVILVINPYRPWYYFILIIGMYLLIFTQIFSQNVSKAYVISEIVFVTINLIYGVTLKYPLYFGATDTFGHLFYSNIVYLSGHVIPMSLDNGYSPYPLYHIWIVESSHLLGLGIQQTLFIITGIAFATTIFYIYLIFNYIIKNKQISLLTCLLYSMSTIVVTYGTYVVTRTMAYIGFLLLLYLLYNDNKNKIIFRILSIFSLIYIILVHNVSIFQIIILFFLLIISEWIVNRERYLSTNFFILIFVFSICYWFNNAFEFAHGVIQRSTSKMQLGDMAIRSEIQTQSNFAIYFQNEIDTIIFLFFALIGIRYLLPVVKSRKYSVTIGLFALVSLMIYVPSPIQVLWQTMKLLRFDRFMLLVSPFMAFVMGVGMYALYNYLFEKGISKNICNIVIISLLMVFAVSSTFDQINTSDSKNLHPDIPRRYLNYQELCGFNYILNNVPSNSALYSDYYAKRFFIQKKYEDSDTLNLPYYKNYKINNFTDLAQYNGYKIIRIEEFNDVGLYFGPKSNNILYSSIDMGAELSNALKKDNRLYSNHVLEIYQSIK